MRRAYVGERAGAFLAALVGIVWVVFACVPVGWAVLKWAFHVIGQFWGLWS